VAKPKCREHVERSCLRTAIGDRNLDQDIFGRRLGVLDEHVEVAVVSENTRVEQLVLEFVSRAD
jgi:hypothetical protein